MGVNESFVGRTFRLAEPFEVTVPALVAFSRAVGATDRVCFDRAAAQAAGYAGIVAAPTFACVIGQSVEALYIGCPEAGIDFSHVVHAEERIAQQRPIVAGDVISAALEVEKIQVRGPLTTVTTRADLTDAGGAPVAQVWSTLAVRGAQSEPAGGAR
ncbi:MAG: MaoC family dehydratase N-terminal domain-containing protein [Bifidobacteriaceae bacterium]|jgi:acyl dehydratase|nr:MaoC family dehydratase N-terminal domain-containing protein [Bifidobacteriaceae bacterium]